ncbi:MIP family channel protein [Colletotrichum higginsianum IMI 349063]|uniref:MIP family channel protein n=2 Tax=Colletotrichum higginsianum TaxID=80884 RepID=A0A1B7YKN6_COLHI|nr:MIP family channel protein [Colletotrichum higginsianum IMI 349063]OBR12631.1 MIP family channel protein [Colletotrichum higginsianum IMI 349063]TIC99459.1 putative membrane protein [Colletotrichum higginsianum]
MSTRSSIYDPGDPSQPLLSQQRRRTSTFNFHLPSFSSHRRVSPLSVRRASLQEVHPHHDDVEPVLPAAPVAAHQETRLHKPQWALSDRPPNTWAQIRHTWREEFAEFWGTFMILLFGAGVECETRLHYRGPDIRENAGDFLQCRLAWAAGVSMAVWMSGGVSGGHCNPTVTVVLALFRGFPWRKVPGFLAAQVLGAALASLAVYLNYATSIAAYEGGAARSLVGEHATAGLFFTFPAAGLPYAGAFYTEFLASAALVAIVFALADKNNLAPPKGTQPFAMFLALLAIGSALGINTGYAMNGARDTGPRIALALVGYGSDVFTHDYYYWLWAPWVAAIAGGVAGACVYDAFIYTGRDSPFNMPRKEDERGL